MKNIFTPVSFILFSLSFSLGIFAGTIPGNKSEFCSRFAQNAPDSEIIQNLSLDSQNLMSFKNNGGLFNSGVCWWHSRFQRNIFYLSLFRPDLNKPETTVKMKELIHKIRMGTEVTIIPGFANLEEFSRDNAALIQNELNDWQLYDGVILGGWMDGLKGDSKVEPALLSKMMNDVYDYVGMQKKIAYEKLQIKGITSHAWLIVGMKKLAAGYEVGYLDSNFPRMSLNYSYKNGDASFFLKIYGDFVPYLEFTREEARLVLAGKVYCGLKANLLQSDEALDLLQAKKDGH
jgi:hypothetical protein